jgi:hypothetical protein
MKSEGKKPRPPAPSRHQEKSIVIQVPPNTSKQEIEKQIHAALAEQPQDIFLNRASKEIIIVVQQEEEPPNGTT